LDVFILDIVLENARARMLVRARTHTRHDLSLRYTMRFFVLDRMRSSKLLEILHAVWCNSSNFTYNICLLITFVTFVNY